MTAKNNTKGDDPKVHITSTYTFHDDGMPPPDNRHRVFIYGSARPGQGPHAILVAHGAEAVGRALYPSKHASLLIATCGVSLVPNEAGPDIHGVLFKVSRPCLAALDRSMGPSNRRVKVRVYDYDTGVESRVWTHAHKFPAAQPLSARLREGDWADYALIDSVRFAEKAKKAWDDKDKPKPETKKQETVIGAVCDRDELIRQAAKSRLSHTTLASLPKGGTRVEWREQDPGRLVVWERDQNGILAMYSYSYANQLDKILQAYERAYNTKVLLGEIDPDKDDKKTPIADILEMPRTRPAPLLGPAPEQIGFGPPFRPATATEVVVTPLNPDVPLPKEEDEPAHEFELHDCRYCGKSIIELEGGEWLSYDQLTRQCHIHGTHFPTGHPLG